MNIKIACAFLAFRNIDIVKMSLESVIEECKNCGHDVDIYVIENRSEFTDSKISPYLDSLVKSKKVHGYAKLDENVTNNAFHLPLDCNLIDTDQYTHIIFTDGDIYVPQGTIQEQLNILHTCPETISCGVSVAYENWTLSNKLDQAKVLKKKRDEALTLDKPYVAIPSGFWFAMFHTSDYQMIYDVISKNGLRVHDGIIQKFVRLLYRREWVQTRTSIGRELHRELVNSSYNNISVKKDFQRSLIEAGHAQKGYELALYYHKKPTSGIFKQADKSIPIRHNIDLLNPTHSKTYKFDHIAQQAIKEISEHSPLDSLYIARKLPPIERCKNLTCLVRYGIGTSFVLEESNSLFLQMRDEALNPLKGPIGFPPLKQSSISKIYVDGFLLQTELTEASCQAFLGSCFESLAVDGFMRLAVVEKNSLASSSGSDIGKKLCRYALISSPSELETDVVRLKNVLSQRNAFIDEEWLTKLIPNSKAELEIRRVKMAEAESNPIDPSLKLISDTTSYLYVYKRRPKSFE